jgi:hypothetical protein
MKADRRRVAAGSVAVCIATWLALAAAAGGVGLQRSISKGALTLFEHPLTIVIVAVMALAVGYLSAVRLRIAPTPMLAGVLIGDLAAGLILAPIAIGELEPIHAPLVVAAVSVLGVQPAAAFVGAWAAGLRARESMTPRE